jgi:NACHT domain-containing protein
LNKVFQAFISYDSLTGKKYAVEMKKAFKRRGLNAFVAHLEQDNYIGDFEKYIDNVISKCKIFSLVITLDVFTRPQVIREVAAYAFPNGDKSKHDFWVFHHDLEAVPRSDSEFEYKTKINLVKENQHEFKDETDLVTKVLIQCDNRQSLKKLSSITGSDETDIESTYDLFASYTQKIKYDYEHHEELRQKHERPLIDVMARSDLYSYFISQNVSYEIRERDRKTGKYRIVQRAEDAQQYLLGFIGGKFGICILLGDYGTGKTSICLNLTYRLAKEYVLTGEGPIPIFVSLRNYGEEKNIYDFLFGILKRQYNIEVNTKILVELIEGGKFVLILDAFDEMTTSSDRNLTLKNFRQILSLSSMKTKIILTSRTHFFRSQSQLDDLLKLSMPSGKSSAIQLAQINPMDQEQIREFLKKRTIEWKDQLLTISQVYNLADLATRPLLLEMISKSMTSHIPYDQNINASYLYKVYTDLWIEYDDWRSVMKPIGKRSFMQELAEKMFLSNKSTIHYRELTKPLSQYSIL